MNTFHASTKLIWDCQAEEALEDIFGKEDWKEIGVVIDTNLLKIPVFESILSKLKELSEKITIFEQEISEPDIDYADTVTSMFREEAPEVMVGIGGGSTLDVAKAVSVLLTNEKDAASYQGFMLVEKPGLPSVMIPTTAGTGSEVTWTAVFTNRKKMLKGGINSPYLFPQYAVLDARLTVSIPKLVTVSTGMDALAHSIESFTAKFATMVSRMISKQAFCLLYRNLPAVINDGADLEARKQMQLGSTLAGWAILNAGTGACHSIAYPLGTYFKVPHGIANAMLLPKVMRRNEDKQPGLYAPLWDAVHPEDASLAESEKSRRLIASLEQFLNEAEFKAALSSFGVSSDDIHFLAAKGLELKSALRNNPVEFGFEDSKAVLKQIL